MYGLQLANPAPSLIRVDLGGRVTSLWSFLNSEYRFSTLETGSSGVRLYSTTNTWTQLVGVRRLQAERDGGPQGGTVYFWLFMVAMRWPTRRHSGSLAGEPAESGVAAEGAPAGGGGRPPPWPGGTCGNTRSGLVDVIA